MSAALGRQIKCTWLSDKMHGGASGGLPPPACGISLYAKNIMGFKSIFLCIVFNAWWAKSFASLKIQAKKQYSVLQHGHGTKILVQ